MDQISHESHTSLHRSQSNQVKVGGFLVIHLGTQPITEENETKSKSENFTWVKKDDGTYQAYCSSCRRRYDPCPRCEKSYEKVDFKRMYQNGICSENLNAQTEDLKTENTKIKMSQNLKVNEQSLLKRKYHKRISLDNPNFQPAIQEKTEIPKIIKVGENLKEKISKKKRMTKGEEEKSKREEVNSKILNPTLTNPSQTKCFAEISGVIEVPESSKDLNV